MTDQQKAQVALTVVYRTCQDALTILSSPEGRTLPDSEASTSPQDLKTLHKDLTSLLTLLYGSITKIALALKPSSPTYSASLTPLKEISDRAAAVAHCALMFDADIHGITLRQEIIFVIKDVLDGIASLAQTFLSVSDANDETYLVRTGAAHNLIDIAKKAPADNVAAVRKRWTQDKGSIEDGVRELSEMIAEAEAEDDENGGDGGEDEDDWGSDGWDELGLSPSRKMDQTELARSKKGFALLRFASLLHKRILQDILNSSDTSAPIPTLDTLPRHSQALLSASDDLIAALYVPQDPENIRAELEAFSKVTSALQESLAAFFPPSPPIEIQLAGMKLEENGSQVAQQGGSSSAKWFVNCFKQITKGLQDLVQELG
ncbi:hypothetical protein HGRIS_013062 [Hohenbuehelia grisea]|uniref:Uncharacterized protein n=2 Tax=Hohenbuehelia grisea TaxID=104357 RepID=A0ABR3IUD5_9AGAR